MFDKKQASTKEIGSLIGAGTVIAGDLSFRGGLRIDGTVRGAVRCLEGEKSGGMLVVSEQGSIEGEVRVAHLVVAGRITGPIYVAELVDLQPKAQITGDLHYKALEMHNGAIVEGMLVHQGDGEARSTPLKLAANNPISAPKPQSGAV